MAKKQKNETNEISDNGCWYCGGLEGDDLTFCSEFDTFVHAGCVMDRLQVEPDDREAIIMARELGLDELKY